MAKAIKKYRGGIHYLIQAAVREDGVMFQRTQNKTHFGYRWGAWKQCGTIDINNLPRTIEAGFSTLYSVDTYTDFGARLPN